MNAWKSYLETLPSEQSNAVLQTLELALPYVPDYEATMSYAMPTLKYKGKGVVAVAAFKNHLGIYPFGKRTVELVQGKLPHADCEVSAIRYAYNQLPTAQDMKLIVETKLKEL